MFNNYKDLEEDMRKKPKNRAQQTATVEITCCPECHYRWDDYAQNHYPDCRYFTLDEEHEEEIEEIYFAQANQQDDLTSRVSISIR